MARLFLDCLTGMLAVGVLAASIPPAAGHEVDFKHLRILHPYTIEPLERLSRDLPVYMVISNSSGASDRLVGAGSSNGGSAAFVTRSPSGAELRPVLGIELPANSQTVMGPDSAHLLLRDLKEPIEGYAYFPIFLVFEKAGKVEIEVFVEDRN
jgi:periplasmic copper chaperone A